MQKMKIKNALMYTKEVELTQNMKAKTKDLNGDAINQRTREPVTMMRYCFFF